MKTAKISSCRSLLPGSEFKKTSRKTFLMLGSSFEASERSSPNGLPPMLVFRSSIVAFTMKVRRLELCFSWSSLDYKDKVRSFETYLLDEDSSERSIFITDHLEFVVVMNFLRTIHE